MIITIFLWCYLAIRLTRRRSPHEVKPFQVNRRSQRVSTNECERIARLRLVIHSDHVESSASGLIFSYRQPQALPRVLDSVAPSAPIGPVGPRACAYACAENASAYR